MPLSSAKLHLIAPPSGTSNFSNLEALTLGRLADYADLSCRGGYARGDYARGEIGTLSRFKKGPSGSACCTMHEGFLGHEGRVACLPSSVMSELH